MNWEGTAMTSKTSFFDPAIFRRSLRKTAPVWGLFAVYELLLPLRLFSVCRSVSVCTDDFYVQIEKTILGYAVVNASIVPFVFGGLLAWVLFSWLFRAGTAYFYASLPVRREALFLTNYLTGVLLCAGPALLSSLLLWAVGGGFGASALLPAMQVFGMTMMGFLLFFSFAVLVCTVVGQTAAVPIVYVILNFTVYVLEQIVQHLLFTFVYGMPYQQAGAMQSLARKASPLLELMQGGVYVAADWVDAGALGYETNPHLVGWGYLGMLAAAGLVFAVCAFFLLRTREMERSGDVIAVGWLRPVALYVFTIGCALVLGALLAELFADSTADNFWYVLLFLFLGAFVGYFFAKMLLQKTIHVFKSGWLGLGVCCAALLVVFGAAEYDLFGYSAYVPERGQIAAAGVTQNQYGDRYTSADESYIGDVLALHTELVGGKRAQERRKHSYQTGTDFTQTVYIAYRLTDDRLIERYYSVVYDESELDQPDSLISQFETLYNSPACVRLRTGFDTPRTEKNVLSCYVYSIDSVWTLELTGAEAWQIYAACLEDINAGRLGAEDVSGVGAADGRDYTPLHMIFTVSSVSPGKTESLYVDALPLDAAATVDVLTALGADPYWRGGQAK